MTKKEKCVPSVRHRLLSAKKDSALKKTQHSTRTTETRKQWKAVLGLKREEKLRKSSIEGLEGQACLQPGGGGGDAGRN